MIASRWAQLEPKLEVYCSILHKDIQVCFARFTGPNFPDFLHAVEEKGFLSHAEGNMGGSGVHVLFK